MTGLGIGIRLGKGGGSSWNWSSLISATVEDAAPTHVILTFPATTTFVASDFTIAGFTVVNGSWSGSVYTLVLSTSVVYGDVLTVVWKGTSSHAVTNHVLTGPELIDQSNWYKSTYWNGGFTGGWVQVGTTLASNGSAGILAIDPFWIPGKTYKVSATLIAISGGVDLFGSDGVYAFTHVTDSGVHTTIWEATQTYLVNYSNNYNGSIIALSVKEYYG